MVSTLAGVHAFQHCRIDPREGEDVTNIVVRRMDDVERNVRRGVPHLRTGS